MKRRRYPNRHVKKLIDVDPTTGRGPMFTRRVIEVLRAEPDLEGWQLQERFGLSDSALQHYRVQAQRRTG